MKEIWIGTGLLCLFFTYYAMLQCSKFLTYYAHVKDLCLKSDCSIRVYSLVLLEYISSAQHSSTNNYYGECSIRVC